MGQPYAGPLRGEPLSVELHNTLFATAGGIVDGLADVVQAQAWTDSVTARVDLRDLPSGPPPSVAELLELRGVIRAALHRAVEREPQEPAVLQAINRAAARSPRSPLARWQPAAAPARATDFHHATRADVLIGEIARDAIDLLTGPRRHDLRSCGAPGCVLMFLREHPRREWCSDACGNRARQARHYRRTRADPRH